MRPIIIAVDGFDGSGKTTLVDRLVRDFVNSGYRCEKERILTYSMDILTSFSDGTYDYVDIVPYRVQALMHLTESYCYLNRLMERDAGADIIVFDRWFFSNVMSVDEWDKELGLIQHIMSRMLKPNLLIYLNTDSRTIVQRLHDRDDWMVQKYTDEQLEIQISVHREKYEALSVAYGIDSLMTYSNERYEYGRISELIRGLARI